jgi:putative PIN family toxin of toxin-antitoxin system
MRVFLDANVLISAFSPGTVANRLLEFVLTRHDLVLGLCVLNETRRILVEKFGANKLLVEIFLDGLLTYAVRVEPIPPVAISRGLRDPDDEVVLASAILGLAEVLVTRDKDLLEEATRFAGEIIIRSPAAFIESYKANA